MQINLIVNLIEILGRTFSLIKFGECGILPVFGKRREWETFIFARMYMIASPMSESEFLLFFVFVFACLFVYLLDFLPVECSFV